MKVLVTGHLGYIGKKVYDRCIQNGWQTIGIDLKEGNDILNIMYNKQLNEFKPDVIFHLAAKPRIQYSIDYPSDALSNNVLGTSRILEYARKQKVKRVVFSSSSSVHGDSGFPISPYALHKLMSEMECKFYSDHFGVDTVSLRYFNVYSEDQQVTDAYPTVIAAWMNKIKEKNNLIVYGDGIHTRDYIHVDDVVSANLFAALYEGKFDGQWFDVGRGENYSLNYIIEFIKSKHRVEFEYLPAKPADPLLTLAKINKLKDLGWYAKIDFENGIKKCF